MPLFKHISDDLKRDKVIIKKKINESRDKRLLHNVYNGHLLVKYRLVRYRRLQ